MSIKIIDPKSGNTFSDLPQAHWFYCQHVANPDSCPFCKKVNNCSSRCLEWVRHHPDESIQMMGYDTLGDSSMRLCEQIGVKPGEVFYLKDEPQHKWRIIYSSILKRMILSSVNWSHDIEDENRLLLAVIETPEKIVKMPDSFSQEELSSPLFKAKRLDNGAWVEGFYMFDERPLIVQDLQARQISNGRVCLDHVYPIDPKTLCCYTGKRDSNGEKLFSNDKICFKEYDGGSMCWVGTIEYDYGSMYVVRGGPNEECESPFELQLSRLDPKNIKKVK